MAEQKLKLWVVGESSGNPEDWLLGDSLQLVLAHSEQQVLELIEIPGPVYEVDLSKLSTPMLIVYCDYNRAPAVREHLSA